MFVFLCALALVFILTKGYTAKKIQARVGAYETRHFRQTDGRSLEIFEHLQKSGASDETLLKFALMEDQFLAYEKDAVCHGAAGNRLLATSLDTQIKETFPAYDFAYHTANIKQMHEPAKLVNRHLSCMR